MWGVCRLRVSCPGLGRCIASRRMLMWQACLFVRPSSLPPGNARGHDDPEARGGIGVGGEGAARSGVLDVVSLARQVSDAHGMRCHLMMCLTMCQPFDGLVFGASKLALQLMRSLAVRGKWALPS